LPGSSLSPALKIGIRIAVLSSFGKMPWVSDRLRMCCRQEAIGNLLSWIIIVVTSFQPTAHDFIFIITLPTSSTVQGLKKIEFGFVLGMYDSGSNNEGGIFLSRSAPMLEK
jgi:hypothetical protein